MAASAEIFKEAASAYRQHHVDASMTENVPFLQSTRSAKQDEHQERERQPLPDGLAGEIRRRSAFSKRRPPVSARISSKVYKLWTVPLAALTVVLVFSALRRRCASLARRSLAPAATGAPFRRLARRESYLAAVCGEGAEEEEDPEELLRQPLAPDKPDEVWVPLDLLGSHRPQDRNGEDAVEIDVESGEPDHDYYRPKFWHFVIGILNAICVDFLIGLFVITILTRSSEHSTDLVVDNVSSIASTSGISVGSPTSTEPPSGSSTSGHLSPETKTTFPAGGLSTSPATPDSTPTGGPSSSSGTAGSSLSGGSSALLSRITGGAPSSESLSSSAVSVSPEENANTSPEMISSPPSGENFSSTPALSSTTPVASLSGKTDDLTASNSSTG